MMQPRILIFDSGMGGLTVASAVARQMPHAHLVYAADNAAFPYGAWNEVDLVQRILRVIRVLNDAVEPDIIVIACNTASTIAMAELRAKFSVPFVGTVPAIKPAAAQTRSGIVGVLATPGTVKREYTRGLIQDFASNCHVVLHGAARLAELAERKLSGDAISVEELRAEIAPAFVERDGQRTDVVVLGCTHYPLLAAEIEAVAPWPVTYIDPSAAIARRVGDVIDITPRRHGAGLTHGSVALTGVGSGKALRSAYSSMGFPFQHVIDLPV
jgi:glutamate racemase